MSAVGRHLTEQEAARYCREEVLAWIGAAGAQVRAIWQPALPDAQVATYRVASTGGGDFTDIQPAVDRAIDDAAPCVIAIEPGYYPGPVYIPKGAPPLSLIGAGQGKVTLAAGIDAQMSGDQYRARFGAQFESAHPATRAVFERIAARERLGTFNTGVLRIEADDVTISGLRVENLYACDRAEAAPEGAQPDAAGRYAQGQHQAVALHVAGADRSYLHDLHLRSFQDTLYLQTPDPFTSTRCAIDDCLIEGDVDFIFGQATAWFDRCELRSRGDRGAQSWVVAPSTNIATRFGFVFCECLFTHDGAEAGRNGTSFLGRQWFEGVRVTPYPPWPEGYICHIGPRSEGDAVGGTISRATLEAVGKCVILESRIGAHINTDTPWDHWGQFWTPRYRPAQSSPADFLENLQIWLRQEQLDYSHLDPNDIWLGVAP